MAITFYCYQVAKARLRLADPHLMEFTIGNQRKQHWLQLFDKIKSAKICGYSQISKFTQAVMDQQELDQGEPYDAEVAEGLHPEHPAELEQIRAEKLRLQEEKEKQTREKEKATKLPTVVEESIEHASRIKIDSD